MENFDIFSPVEDWTQNIHIAYNPHSICVEQEDFSTRWKELFSVPYIDQSDDVTFEANSTWLECKKNFISGSEVASALNFNPYEDREEYMNIKAGLKEKKFTERQKEAMMHGKQNEGKAGLLYTWEMNDVTYKFGIIPHPDPKWRFLAVSPDLIGQRLVEIKSPGARSILYPMTMDQLEYSDEVKALARDVLITGCRYKYMAITNLPLKLSKLFDKLVYYYHQIQLQWEVIRIGDSVDFVQYGTSPNKYYLKKDLLTVTNVPCDDTWIRTHGEMLQRTWDEIQYRKVNRVSISTSEEEECPFISDVITKKMSIKNDYYGLQKKREQPDEECPFITSEYHKKKRFE